MIASNEIPPDEKVARDEFINDVLRLIANLPEQQRAAVTYRYARNLSVAETSRIMGLPEGTVKSNASYGLKALRKQLGIEIKTNKTSKKGAAKMKSCTDIYGMLFEYAKGYLTQDERAEIQTHIAACDDCAKIVNALTALWPYLQREFGQEGHDNYFNVTFEINDGVSLQYVGFSNEFTKKQVKDVNETLVKNNGKIPEWQTIIDCGHDADIEQLSEYCNEGGKIEFEIQKNTPTNVRVIHKSMPRLYETHWIYSVFMHNDYTYIKQSKDAPNLYQGYISNYLGKASKCGMFAYIEDGATNIRIKKGSGVLDLDGYKFAYSARFTTEDEKIDLSFTYNK